MEFGKEIVLTAIPVFKNGLDTIENWISETAMPKTVAFVKSMIAFFNTKMSQGVTAVNEFMEQQHVGMKKSID